MAAPIESPTSNCTRRRILGWGGAGALGGLAGYLGWPSEPTVRSQPQEISSTRERNRSGATPSEASISEVAGDGSLRDDFLPHLNSRFRIDSLSQTGVDCQLVEIGAMQQLSGNAGNFTSFSLLFTAPVEFAAESRTYQVSHREMGVMEIFLSPVGSSENGLYLEAVFSQRV